MTDWLSAAERRGSDWWAAGMLLALNGLRCGELIACDVTDVGSHSWHHTLALRTTKGDKPTVVALAPPTMQAIEAAVAGRSGGPLLRNAAGRRMTAFPSEGTPEGAPPSSGPGWQPSPTARTARRTS